MLARQPQARLWNRTNSNFPKTQGPVARKKSQKATQILRAGNFLSGPRDNPRNGVRGKATMSTKCSSEPSPVAFWLLCRHGQSNSPPAGGEIPLRGTKPLYHRPLIRPSVRTGAPSPQGEGLGKTKRDRFWTCPLKHRGETQFRRKFLCLLSFSKKVRGPGSPPGPLTCVCCKGEGEMGDMYDYWVR